jgi:hypothetical protein
MIYINVQNYLTKKEKPKTAKAVPETLNNYRALEIYRLVGENQLILHCYQYVENFYNKLVAYALAIGYDVIIRVESINTDICIKKYDNCPTHRYKYIEKESLYNYLREQLAPYKEMLMEVDDEIQYLKTKNNHSPCFKVTDEVKNFIITYADAYGIQIPRFEDKETDYLSYLPKHWFKIYSDILNKSSDPQASLKKWDMTERNNKRATPLSEIERIYRTLKYYVNNNIPYNDNYIPCPICGRPMRTNRYGITDLVENDSCRFCNGVDEQEHISFNEAYMTKKIY